MPKISIILVDWSEYPLYRQKKLNDTISVSCGLGAILDNMAKYNAGVDYEITVIITGINSPFYEYCVKQYRSIRHYLMPKKYSNERVNWYREKTTLYETLLKKYPFVKCLIFKNNTGQDIGAYNYGYQLLKKDNYQGDVVFMNSALEGPNENNWLLKYNHQFLKHDNTGLCGITINPKTKNLVENDFSPHVQSFFLYTNMNVLRRVFPANLSGYNIKNNRLSLILQGEIGISRKILDAGYSITSISFPDYCYKKGDPWNLPYEEIRYKK
ncbi:MAG: hypothetical protein PHR16_09470, partial [Methylovulum sp.]|nr:hypothetical protein [Methylovulum sp.]